MKLITNAQAYQRGAVVALAAAISTCAHADPIVDAGTHEYPGVDITPTGNALEISTLGVPRQRGVLTGWTG